MQTAEVLVVFEYGTTHSKEKAMPQVSFIIHFVVRELSIPIVVRQNNRLSYESPLKHGGNLYAVRRFPRSVLKPIGNELQLWLPGNKKPFRGVCRRKII